MHLQSSLQLRLPLRLQDTRRSFTRRNQRYLAAFLVLFFAAVFFVAVFVGVSPLSFSSVFFPLFVVASIVEVSPEQLPEAMGPSLVATAITKDSKLIERLIASPLVDRLNLGAIPTNQVVWDQPHEGNLFEHLYSRRAFQKAV